MSTSSLHAALPGLRSEAGVDLYKQHMFFHISKDHDVFLSSVVPLTVCPWTFFALVPDRTSQLECRLCLDFSWCFVADVTFSTTLTTGFHFPSRTPSYQCLGSPRRDPYHQFCFQCQGRTVLMQALRTFSPCW